MGKRIYTKKGKGLDKKEKISGVTYVECERKKRKWDCTLYSDPAFYREKVYPPIKGIDKGRKKNRSGKKTIKNIDKINIEGDVLVEKNKLDALVGIEGNGKCEIVKTKDKKLMTCHEKG